MISYFLPCSLPDLIRSIIFQDSTGGDDDLSLSAEDIGKLEPTMLLYKAAAAHNLPVMCRALALGADKNWRNHDDRNRLALHQAVISVSIFFINHLIVGMCN